MRVCVTGAECTGKTTLSQALGRHYSAPVLFERGRDYFVHKTSGGDASVYTSDVIHIVDLQVRLEDSAPLNVPLVLLDTDVFTISVWHERSSGRRLTELDRLARIRQSTDARVDLYLLLSPDIPFVHDGVRTGDANRIAMHDVFREALQSTKRPFVEIGGPLENRITEATAAIDQLLTGKPDPVSDASSTLQ